MQVLTSMKTTSWLTPAWLVSMAKEVLGEIDLDPASCERAQAWIQARRYYTIETDAFAQSWESSSVWLNPPFDDTPRWTAKLVEEFDAGRVKEAILLVNANVGYVWFTKLWERFPCCLLRERVRFIKEDGSEGGQSKRAQAVFYLGPNRRLFQAVFQKIGKVVFP